MFIFPKTEINKDENVHVFALSAIRGELMEREKREKKREREIKKEIERERATNNKCNKKGEKKL